MKIVLATLILNFSVLSFAQIPNSTDLTQKANNAAVAGQAEATKSQSRANELTQKAKDKALVNLNTASADDLAKLPGIGPVKAKAIIDARPYTKIEDLKKVKGIKEGVINKIKDHVTL